MNYIRTYTGLKFHTTPRADDFDIRDIARGLACASRWGGHTKWWYPVAAHAIFVARMLPPELQFDGLMHDISEAYFCDIPSPFKGLMPEYKEIEHTIMVAGADRFNYQWPPPALVKIADAIALRTEHEAFFPAEYSADIPKIKIPSELCIPKNWSFAGWESLDKQTISNIFLNEFRKLRR